MKSTRFDRKLSAPHLAVSLLAFGLILGMGAAGCGEDGPPIDPSEEFTWDLPESFPTPRVPEDNPMTLPKIELGRHLFYDIRLSENETQSCGSCHLQELAFTDGLARAEGSTGAIHPRSSMALGNVGYQATLTWASSIVRSLETQALLPIFGESPIVELGLAGKEDLLVERLTNDPEYPEMFSESFPADPDPISVMNIVRALAAFQRTLITGNSEYDRYAQGQTDAMSESAIRGATVFFGERADCFHCHGGFNFSSSVDHAGNVFDSATFFNNGLYNVDGRGAYPPANTGLFESTGEALDMGRFKPPSLRNIALTAPYMHDGSIETLEEVVDMYAAGGRNLTEGPFVGDGRASPNKNPFVHGFELTEQERTDLLTFLRSLTDREFTTNPAFSDPF